MPAARSQHWMAVLRAAFPRRLVIVVGLILVVQVVVIGMLLSGGDLVRPRRVPITVVATSPLVAQAVADRAAALDGDPFVPEISDAPETARQQVREGATAAALLVDLTGTLDQLVVNGGTDPQLIEAVQDLVVSTEAAQGRTVEIEEVHAAGALADSTDATYAVTLLASLLAFALIIGISLVRGPIARTVQLGVLRVAGIGVAAVVAAAALSAATGLLAGPDPLLVIGVVMLAFLATGTLTSACEGLLGWAGLAVAGAAFAVLATPLLSRTHPDLLPRPWGAVSPWTPSGATLQALWSITAYGGHALTRPVLVSASWCLVAVIALLLARWLRSDLGVVLTDDGVLVETSADHPRALVVWRTRVLVVVVPTAALLLIGAELIGGDAVASPTRPPSTAAETSCVATGDIETVAGLNRTARDLRSEPGFQGGDVGADAALQGGQRIWMFGDTLRDKSFDGQRFVRNSMLLDYDECLSVVYPESKGAIVPDRPDGVGYWPMSVTAQTYPGYDLAYVGLQRVRSTGDTAFSFESLGPAIAVFLVPRGGTPQLVDQVDLGPDTADITKPMWGAAAVSIGDWVYLYGTANPGDGSAYGSSVRVARMRGDDILDQDRWTYWDGSAWSEDPDDATELIGAVGGVSQTFSVFGQHGEWHALSKKDDFLGTDVAVWTAPDPWGPFSDPVTVAELPSDASTGQLRYMPLAHPDLLPADGSVLVSYSRNRVDVTEIVEDPMLYRPRFLRVDIP